MQSTVNFKTAMDYLDAVMESYYFLLTGSVLNKSLEPNPRTVTAVAEQLPRQPLVRLNINR